MPGMDRGKYQVVDRKKGSALSPDDYFVIKKSDILGLATLQSYRSNILTLLDLDYIHQSLSQEQRNHLLILADDVGDLAMSWETGQRKIPD